MDEPQSCDRCDSTIITNSYRERRPLILTLPDESNDTPEYEQHPRVLCSACEQDLLEWIDGDFQREDAVELPDGYSTGETFRRFASELEEMADEMEDHA